MGVTNVVAAGASRSPEKTQSGDMPPS